MSIFLTLGETLVAIGIASYRGPCSAEYDEGVRRLRSRRATLWSVEKRPTSLLSEGERLCVSLPRRNSSPFLRAYRAKREQSR